MDVARDVDSRGDHRQRLLAGLRVIAIVVPLGFLVGRVHPAEVPRAIATVGVSGFVAAFVSMVGSVLVGALRWRVLIRAFGAPEADVPGLSTLVRHIFVGLYFAMIPSGIVGELLRAQRTAHVFEEPATAYAVILVDRAAASFGLVTLGLVSVFASDFGIDEAPLLGSVRVILALAWVVSAAVVAIPFGFGSPRMRAKIGAIPRLGALLVRVLAAPDPARIASILVLSIAVEVLTSAAVFATVVPFATHAVLVGIALAAPAILLLTFMPLTPGALGQRELAFVSLLGPVGITATDATAAAIVTLAVGVLLALVGFGCLVVERRIRAA